MMKMVTLLVSVLDNCFLQTIHQNFRKKNQLRFLTDVFHEMLKSLFEREKSSCWICMTGRLWKWWSLVFPLIYKWGNGFSGTVSRCMTLKIYRAKSNTGFPTPSLGFYSLWFAWLFLAHNPSIWLERKTRGTGYQSEGIKVVDD